MSEWTTDYKTLKEGDVFVMKNINEDFVVAKIIPGESIGAGGMSESYYWTTIITTRGIVFRFDHPWDQKGYEKFRPFKVTGKQKIEDHSCMILSEDTLQEKEKERKEAKAYEKHQKKLNKIRTRLLKGLSVEEKEALGLERAW
jgi:hypothetical protein